MIRYFSLFLFAVLVPNIGIGQDLKCSDFHTGTFQLEAENMPNIMVSRDKEIQIEKSPTSNIIFSGKITWIDDCTYEVVYTAATEEMIGKKVRVSLLEIIGNRANCKVTFEIYPDVELPISMIKN